MSQAGTGLPRGRRRSPPVQRARKTATCTTPVAHVVLRCKLLTCTIARPDDEQPTRPQENRRHSGIGLNTPADVHYGLAAAKATERAAVLAAARGRNPERFATTKDPKILTIPDTAWINKPAEKDERELAA